jgi:hypothetical protein
VPVSLNPLQLASLVSRNLVPVGGALFLGWSAPDLLVLYYVDTILAFAAVLVLVGRHVTGLGKAGGPTRPVAGAGDWIRMTVGALVAALFIGVPLGVPLFILLAEFNWSPTAAFARDSFVIGLLMQVGATLTVFWQAHQELLQRTDDDHVLKHRAAFIVARWAITLLGSMFGIAGVLGPRLGGAAVLLVYAGASIYFEMFPGSALAWLNPKEARADARAQTAQAERAAKAKALAEVRRRNAP